MGELPTDASPVEEPRDDRLDSWKEIAAHLRRDVTTVQRWEKREGMPVRRHLHDRLGSVYAFRSELDRWAGSRNLRSAQTDSELGTLDPQSNLAAPADVGLTATSRPRARLAWSVAASALVLALATAAWLAKRAADVWHNPLDGARFQTVTDFGGTEQAAAISRDGRFAAFLSDRDGQTDVWVTQIGTGQFYNLTRGRFRELVNPSIRTLGFSPDGSLVTCWVREGGADRAKISVWAIPTLGGQPRPYLEGAAEFDWARNGARLVYHTPAAGDPMFVRESAEPSDRLIFTATAGQHAHFPLWSSNGAFIYFVQGELPDALDIWRIRSEGGAPEPITHDRTLVSHPVLLDDRTLLYLATDQDGSGPWLYSLDVATRVSRRASSGLDRYFSLAASADGRRLVATLAEPRITLWRLPVGDSTADGSAIAQIPLTTAGGSSPRLGRDYLLYVSSNGTGNELWKLAGRVTTELWTAPNARIVGGPDIAPDGGRIALTVAQGARTVLYVMNADGTNARAVTSSLALRGDPAWTPDGQSIVVAIDIDGTPRLFRVSLDGRTAPLADDYSIDPLWSPRGDFLVYSGPDVGTTFPVRAVTAGGRSYPLPAMTLTRGARRLRFFRQQPVLVALRGDIPHKNLWLIDLQSGAGRQLTNLPSDFDLRDFDISADGREIVLERIEEHSDVVLIDRARPN